MMEQKGNKFIFWIIHTLNLILSIVFIFMTAREWYFIKIAQNYTSYLHKKSSLSSSFSSSMEAYAQTNLWYALIFIAIMIITIWEISKEKLKAGITTLAFALFWIGVMIYHGFLF